MHLWFDLNLSSVIGLNANAQQSLDWLEYIECTKAWDSILEQLSPRWFFFVHTQLLPPLIYSPREQDAHVDTSFQVKTPNIMLISKCVRKHIHVDVATHNEVCFRPGHSAPTSCDEQAVLDSSIVLWVVFSLHQTSDIEYKVLTWGLSLQEDDLVGCCLLTLIDTFAYLANSPLCDGVAYTTCKVSKMLNLV